MIIKESGIYQVLKVSSDPSNLLVDYRPDTSVTDDLLYLICIVTTRQIYCHLTVLPPLHSKCLILPLNISVLLSLTESES